KILIMNLSKGRVGEDSSMLMGAMIITKIQQAAMSRIDMDEEHRPDFYLYVDEFQNFATESFAGILSEARKYRLDLTLAHQYIAQLEEEVRDAVVGNAGTLITFRIGADDAEFFEKEFSPEIMALDLVNLPNQKIYLKLMIDGVTSRAFSANTLPPIAKPEKSFKDEIIEYSRKTYGTPRSVVEEQIRAWSEPVGVVFREREPGGPAVTDLGEKSERKTAEKGDLTFHDATCDNCGKTIQVPFVPDPKRKTYCKTCLPAMKAQAAKKKEMATVQPEEAHLEMTIPAPSALSLNDALQRAPQKFTVRKSEAGAEKKQRKGPDVEGLRDILAHSLEGMRPAPAKPTHATEEKNTITLEDISKF
ncbi:MAG: CxxC-x17-CxxC domain-containing protein, partial [Patescibacteria group bacterium]